MTRRRFGGTFFCAVMMTCACGGDSESQDPTAEIRDATVEEAPALVADAFCTRLERCGGVSLGCADSPTGSLCDATLEQVDFDACIDDAAEDFEREIDECGFDDELADLYARCYGGALDSECVTQAELDAYYDDPNRDRSSPPQQRVLPAACNELASRIDACQRPASRPPAGS